jgi:hypothetical protein
MSIDWTPIDWAQIAWPMPTDWTPIDPTQIDSSRCGSWEGAGHCHLGSPSNAAVRLRRTCRIFCAIAKFSSTLGSDLLRLAVQDQTSAAHRQEQIFDHGGGRNVHPFEERLQCITEFTGTLSRRPENRDVARVPQDGTSAWEGDSNGLAR